MAPLQKAASNVPLKASAEADSPDIQQSGRSSASLNAERAAASLRDVEPKPLEKSKSTPNLLQKTPSNESDESAHDNRPSTGLTPPPSQQRRPSAYRPAVSSPLRDSSSGSSNELADEPKRPSDESRPSSDHIKPAGSSPSRRRPPPRPPLRHPANQSTPELSELGAYRVNSPLTMRDLGTDYTRYFNPFSDSRRSSFVEKPTTPLPLYPASSRAVTPVGPSSPANPFLTPNASTTMLNTDYDAEKHGSLVDDRLAAPYDEKGSLAWPLFTDKEEDDDEMHMPHPDDDIKYKAKWSDHFSRANIASTIGLFFMILGLLFVFVALPVMSYAGIINLSSTYGTPLSQMPKYFPQQETWATVNNETYPLLQNIRTGLIDPDTPKSAMTMQGDSGEEFVLVFSDEFNDNNRTFYEGDDPFWFAPDIWYGATQDLEWYDPDAVTTWDGTLELRLDKFINHGLNFRSGMLNSWNHVCFKGGIFEVSMSLPGPAAVMGLWPGAWTMGNLGRPGYLSTTDGMWPYTYQECDVGITPNQSSYDGMSRLPGQRLPSCTCPGEDHPTPGTGRGAPEIDIVEGGASYGGLPIATQSFQVAPFDIWWYPDYNFTAFPDLSISSTNGYTGGPFQQAISATTNLNKNWYDGKQYQKYSFEYEPGEGENAYIIWKVGGETTFEMDGRAIGPNGNIKARQIAEEPMSIVLNLGISNSWTWIDWEHLVFPTVMRVDYVRWYQKAGEEMVTCDPPGFETTQYIKDHINAYTNPNFTRWDQTGHGWPKHKLNSDC
ncbi:beta-glucan synthesis-associated [Corynespora cassiicola Philippines]|uniref:Beta-glucan synthesis-associated n=1 Tax=Corynespora cassiicola Philippines TaxID=1448308 RepID=A0A2T2NYV6_CORCC|nr:beta-glucan synthesis-associated [Corynespora cassiicola Philippines]